MANEFDALSRAAATSVVGRMVEAGRRGLASAWAASRAVAACRTRLDAWRTLPADHRFSSTALTVGWALCAYTALLAITPRYVATGLPSGWFLGMGILAFAAAAGGPSIVRAWPGSRLARTLRWLAG